MKLDQVALLEKIAQLRKKWAAYNKKGDLTMCDVIERQAKIYKDLLEEKTAPETEPQKEPDDNTAFAEELFTHKDIT